MRSRYEDTYPFIVQPRGHSSFKKISLEVMFVPDPDFYPSRIWAHGSLDPISCIPDPVTASKRVGEKSQNSK
jgi:hypothetical protein